MPPYTPPAQKGYGEVKKHIKRQFTLLRNLTLSPQKLARTQKKHLKGDREAFRLPCLNPDRISLLRRRKVTELSVLDNPNAIAVFHAAFGISFLQPDLFD
jgi:hypothetical protein